MNKITLKDFLECCQYRITSCDEFLWECYGENALSMESWNGNSDSNGASICCVFDSKTSEVYEMQAWDYKNFREYRWTNPKYSQKRIHEAASREINDEDSCDGRKFIDLDLAEDILEKSEAILEGRNYDERIIVQLDMTSEEELLLMRTAHSRDMSVNEFVEIILQEKINELTGSGVN